MSNDNPTIPPSIIDYVKNPGVRTAVDTLVFRSERSTPDDIEWKELRSYHQAVLSAYKVRCDYALFLMDIWDSVWDPLIRHAPALKRDQVSNMPEYWKPGPKQIWDDSFVVLHRIPDRTNKPQKFFTAVWWSEEDGLVSTASTLTNDDKVDARFKDHFLNASIDSYEHDENWCCSRIEDLSSHIDYSTNTVDISDFKRDAKRIIGYFSATL